MCGRYLLYEAEQLADRFHVEDWDGEFRKNFNVAPEQVMPVITEDGNGRHLEFMRWGIPRFIKKDVEKELINTRAESAFSPFWNKIVLNKRVLVPANGFYEWKKMTTGPKKPFLIHPKKEKLFAFAGIWNTWKDHDGKEWNVYSIMTTEPNKEMAAVHNRMPVILHEADEAAWLRPDSVTRDDIEPLLRPLEDNSLEMYEVSRDVNVVRNNFDKLIYPVNSQ